MNKVVYWRTGPRAWSRWAIVAICLYTAVVSWLDVAAVDRGVEDTTPLDWGLLAIEVVALCWSIAQARSYPAGSDHRIAWTLCVALFAMIALSELGDWRWVRPRDQDFISKLALAPAVALGLWFVLDLYPRNVPLRIWLAAGMILETASSVSHFTSAPHAPDFSLAREIRTTGEEIVELVAFQCFLVALFIARFADGRRQPSAAATPELRKEIRVR